MILKKGVDLTFCEVKDDYIFTLKTFPVSMYGNLPYRNQTFDKTTHTLPKAENSMEDAIESMIKSIDSIQDKDNCPLTFYTTENSVEHSILLNSKYKDSIQFNGCKVKKDSLKELRDNYLEDNSPTIKKTSKSYDNCIFLDFDFNTEELFKTHEISIIRYDNINDLNRNTNEIFESNHISNSLEKSNHDWFIDLIKPHVKQAYNEGKVVYVHSKSYHMPYVSSLNKSLKNEGLDAVNVKQKTSPIYKVKKELSYSRIRKFMIKKYDNLKDLSDKHVCYCDGSSVLLNDLNNKDNGVLNSSAFIFREENQEDFNFSKRGIFKQDEQIYAEVNAFVESIDFIINNNKNNKPIHFVFDSDYVFKSFQAILNNNYDRIGDKCKDVFMKIKEKIENHNLELEGIILKSHQVTISNKSKHEVVLYNEKVDKLAKQNLFSEAQAINTNKNRKKAKNI